MSYAQSSSATTLEDRHLANLIYILRDANYRYQRIASDMRQNINPTQHARLRARNLGLRLNIDLALQLDQRFVSAVPLPVIVTSPPPPAVARSAGITRAAQRCVPKIVIPAPARRRTQALTSQWSPSPVAGPSQAGPIHHHINGGRREVDAPMDVQGLEEEEEEVDDQSMASVSSADDSCGLVTPENMMPINHARVKRKLSEVYISGKRTKYDLRA